MSEMEGLKVTHTDFSSIIIPPPDVRNIVDKTAQFVAKNGLEFEQRVRLDKGTERKFAFLLPGNPYRAYYDAKVREFMTGEVNEAAHPQIPQAIIEIKRKELEKQKKKKDMLALSSYAIGATDPGSECSAGDFLKLTGELAHEESSLIKSMAIEDDKPPDAPEEDVYTATRPFAAALDIDVIKLTAQYVARNGQRFLVGLSQRERGNAQFAFLRATHSLFAYFTTLVEAYTRCLVPEKSVINRLKENLGKSSRFDAAIDNNLWIFFTDLLKGPRKISTPQLSAALTVFDRIMLRQRWEEYDARQRQEKAKEEAEEREQMHALDWHDFVVVEVIEFTNEDENLALLPPIEINHLTQPKPIAPLVPPQEMDMNLEPPTTVPTITADYESLKYDKKAMIHLENAQSGFSDAPQETVSPATMPIMIVSDYVRQPKKRNRQSEKMMKCPITGQWIPADQMTEHLRILLLDPKWKEEKNALLAKAQKGSAFAAEGDFESNLANFVVKRPDLFGSVDDECEFAYVPVPKRK